MSWFDTVSESAGSVYDWFRNAGGSEAEAGTGTTTAPVPAPAAQSSGSDSDTPWHQGTAAKALGIAPWAKLLGGGGGGDSSAKPTAGGGARSTSRVTGNDKTEGQGFSFTDPATGKFKMPEGWRTPWARGTSTGNREEDAKAKEAGKNAAHKLPEVWQPDLSKLDGKTPGTYSEETGVKDRYDADATTTSGSFRSSKGGSYSGGSGFFADKAEGKFAVDHTGKGGIDIGGWQGQWGAEEKGGWRGVAVGEGKRQDGKANLAAQGEAGWVASGGASATAGIDTKKGLYGQAGVGGKVGVYAQGDADALSDQVKVGSVDYDAGIGVHGETFVGAKAGASGEIGIGPDFVGAKGSAGAFAGAEAAGDVHGHVGPVGGKVGGSVMAGAGAGIEGDLSYKDGKFHVGGKMFAALGYGGSLSGGVTVDVGAIGRNIGDAYDYVADSPVGEFAGDVADTASDVGGAISDGAGAAWDTGGDAVSAVLSW